MLASTSLPTCDFVREYGLEHLALFDLLLSTHLEKCNGRTIRALISSGGPRREAAVRWKLKRDEAVMYLGIKAQQPTRLRLP